MPVNLKHVTDISCLCINLFNCSKTPPRLWSLNEKVSFNIWNKTVLSAPMCNDFHALCTSTIQLPCLFPKKNRLLGGWATLYICPLLSIQPYDCFSSTKLKPQGWWAWHGDQNGGRLRTAPIPTHREGITHL